MKLGETIGRFAEFIERGGLYRGIAGSTPREVLNALAETLPPVPSVPPSRLLEAILEREALMSTGADNGIALPHPRTPLVTGDREQFVALAFLQNPVNWNSLDGKPVDTLLLIVSASVKQHLGTLSEISFFCRQEAFLGLLKERASLEVLLRFINETEKSWKKTEER